MRDIERDEAIPARDKALTDLAQQAFRTALWMAHRPFGPAEDPGRWRAFMDDLRGELERVIEPPPARRR